MRFFLYEVVARIVAIYLCVDCWRRVRLGLAERKIAYMGRGDLMDWFFDWSKVIAYRDATPIRYWMQIGFQSFTLVACVVMAIFGWWHPDS
jgi:hypothetical protein